MSFSIASVSKFLDWKVLFWAAKRHQDCFTYFDVVGVQRKGRLGGQLNNSTAVGNKMFLEGRIHYTKIKHIPKYLTVLALAYIS